MTQVLATPFIYLIVDSRLFRRPIGRTPQIPGASPLVPAKWSVVGAGTPEWGGKTAMAAHEGSLFVLQNSRLHRVDPTTGRWIVLGGEDWGQMGSQALLIAARGNSLFIIQNGYFHIVSPVDGSWKNYGDQRWGKATALAASPTGIFVTHETDLYIVASSGPNIGKAKELYPNRDEALQYVQAMTALDNVLYLVNGENRLVRIDDRAETKVERLGSDTFPDTQAMTSFDGNLYIWSRSLLYRVDPREQNPRASPLDDACRPGPVSMAALSLHVPGSGGLPAAD